ncbi:hypothetical protein ZWY2020_004571 [Hordeum vulgare]|nr:hypothetical protein ZWY2020_004571 [Hordeum vulgare]
MEENLNRMRSPPSAEDLKTWPFLITALAKCVLADINAKRRHQAPRWMLRRRPFTEDARLSGLWRRLEPRAATQLSIGIIQIQARNRPLRKSQASIPRNQHAPSPAASTGAHRLARSLVTGGTAASDCLATTSFSVGD